MEVTVSLTFFSFYSARAKKRNYRFFREVRWRRFDAGIIGVASERSRKNKGKEDDGLSFVAGIAGLFGKILIFSRSSIKWRKRGKNEQFGKFVFILI